MSLAVCICCAAARCAVSVIFAISEGTVTPSLRCCSVFLRDRSFCAGVIHARIFRHDLPVREGVFLGKMTGTVVVEEVVETVPVEQVDRLRVLFPDESVPQVLPHD